MWNKDSFKTVETLGIILFFDIKVAPKLVLKI